MTNCYARWDDKPIQLFPLFLAMKSVQNKHVPLALETLKFHIAYNGRDLNRAFVEQPNNEICLEAHVTL